MCAVFSIRERKVDASARVISPENENFSSTPTTFPTTSSRWKATTMPYYVSSLKKCPHKKGGGCTFIILIHSGAFPFAPARLMNRVTHRIFFWKFFPKSTPVSCCFSCSMENTRKALCEINICVCVESETRSCNFILMCDVGVISDVVAFVWKPPFVFQRFLT